MKLVGTVLLLLMGFISAFSQDCTPCVGVNKLQITSALDPNDTLSQLNTGTQVGLYVRIDDAVISGISEDFTRLLEFTDSNKGDLLRKGRKIESVFEGFILRSGDVQRMINGINLQTVRISSDGHILYLNVETHARPSSGAQSIYLEGQLGVNVNTELTQEVLLKNVILSQEEANRLNVEGHDIELTFVRTEVNGPVTSHIFSYTGSGIIGVSESATRSDTEQLAENEFRVSGFDNLELMVEIPKTEVREIPFTLTFGLGL